MANYGAAFDYLEARDCAANGGADGGATGRAVRACRPSDYAPTGWGRAKRRRECQKCNEPIGPKSKCATCTEEVARG